MCPWLRLKTGFVEFCHIFTLCLPQLDFSLGENNIPSFLVIFFSPAVFSVTSFVWKRNKAMVLCRTWFPRKCFFCVFVLFLDGNLIVSQKSKLHTILLSIHVTNTFQLFTNTWYVAFINTLFVVERMHLWIKAGNILKCHYEKQQLSSSVQVYYELNVMHSSMHGPAWGAWNTFMMIYAQ